MPRSDPAFANGNPLVGMIDVRPGFTLSWGPTIMPPPTDPTDTAACLTYQLEPEPGRMILRRSWVAGDCPASANNFYATIRLTSFAAEALVAGDSGAGAAALRRFLSGGDHDIHHPLTARARLAIESIRRCPFAGACRAMAITARGHDLLVEFLTAWSESLHPAPTAAPGPTAGVRLAAEYIERDLEHPPALPELAARAGLSETTLKRTFPRVFGTTVFGYLRRRRMEEARRLLDTGTATVLEAAAQVGYSNPSNFAAAFRREFGVNPKTHQLATRQ